MPGRDRFGDVDRAADDAVVSDGCVATQHAGAGVDDDAVPECRVSFCATDHVAGVIDLETFVPECDTLVDADVFTDLCCFTDDDSPAMVDEKRFSDAGGGVDVDPGA